MRSGKKLNPQNAAFRDWFNRKWAEWDVENSQHTQQQELADYLGVTRSAVASYVAAGKIPKGKNLRKIAKKFGEEIYMIFELPEPSDEFSKFPASLAERLRSASDEIEDLLISAKFAPGSPEYLEAVTEICSRFGLSVKDTKIKA